MKEIFELDQNILIKHNLNLIESYILHFVLANLGYNQKGKGARVREEDKQVILKQLSFLDMSKRTLDKHIRNINELMFSYQLGFFELNTLSTDIDVFGYPVAVVEKHDLALKDMLIISYINNASYSENLYHIAVNNKKYTYISQSLFIHDFPILELSPSGLKRRINVLIAKNLVERLSFYDNTTKSRKNYYRINIEKLYS